MEQRKYIIIHGKILYMKVNPDATEWNYFDNLKI